MAGDRQPNLSASVSSVARPAAILDSCDRILGEVGRRQHLFSWLRPPGQTDAWLPVDAYYPAHRLIVTCREAPGQHDHLFGELVPARGLRLLELDPAQLGEDSEQALRDQIARLELPPRRVLDQSVGANSPRESPVARVSASLAQAAAPPVHQRRVDVRRSREPARSPSLAVGLAVGAALALAIVIEMYVGVGNVALGGGHWVLALGLAFDAVSRALGTVAAGRAGEPGWAWWCLLGGSPVVAAFTLFGRESRIDVEPGPIAGLVSILALTLILLALGGALLGI